MVAVIAPDAIVRASSHQVSNRVGEEVAILELDQGCYYGLEPVGAFVWRHLEAPISVSKLHEAVVTEYEVDPQVARRDLLALLEEMHAAGLIEVAGGSSD